MANALYANGKQAMLAGSINFSSDNIRAALVNTSYPTNLANDADLTAISTYIVGTAQLLAGKSITAGVFDANDVSFTSLAAGSNVKAVVLYKDTGTPATSTLLAYIDTITGFPLATNGGDVTVQWDNGAFRIFSL